MPVPAGIEPAPGVSSTPHRPSQKSMTKAERRELQERQRAAKLVQKSSVNSASSVAPSGTAAIITPSKSKPPSTPSHRKFSGDVSGAGAGKSSITKDHSTVSSTAVDDGMGGRTVSRGLRIFSHFGLPKPIGYSIKGDIHPAIIRLGLLFSEFRICGANARCIATLTAFKTVS